MKVTKKNREPRAPRLGSSHLGPEAEKVPPPPPAYRSAASTESLYMSASESAASSALCDAWSSCPAPFWHTCPYTWISPPLLPGMMQWESSGVLASWAEPAVDGTPLTWPVLVVLVVLVVLDDPGGRRHRAAGVVGGEGGVTRRDRVPVDRDEALVGLRHRHGRPGLHGRHLALGGEGLRRVEVPRGGGGGSGGGGGGVAGVAEVAHGAGAQRGQQLPLPHHLHHLLVGEAVVGLQPVAEDLPQHHAERPDVRVRAELAVRDGLRRHPADGQQRLGVQAVVVRGVDGPGEAQVRDLDVQLLAHQNVPGRQVFVGVEVAAQVLHPSRHLGQKQRENHTEEVQEAGKVQRPDEFRSHLDGHVQEVLKKTHLDGHVQEVLKKTHLDGHVQEVLKKTHLDGHVQEVPVVQAGLHRAVLVAAAADVGVRRAHDEELVEMKKKSSAMANGIATLGTRM
ncbi:hypothetical protein EYF80_044847 [Liparis tanakae]|uniref:Uncharacterized protein n=1 Tax=Liparis tanakae TaxID=230148 RepID=A0A4Z2FVP5_9TELE|nr:hypothetical protein EYF80_044847 [Liparis tanakae]